jgi:hypothetical protein
LATADVVIYGPGTQHSSLLPSYRILASAIRHSPAPLKVMVSNLAHDNDIQGLDATELIDLVLRNAGDSDNRDRVISHLLYNALGSDGDHQGVEDALTFDPSALDGQGRYLGARIVQGRFANPSDPRIHSGHRVVRAIVDLFEGGGKVEALPSIDIYLDLLDRSLALDNVTDEFLEIDWQAHFEQARLRINNAERVNRQLPDHLSIESTSYNVRDSEVVVLRDWLARGTSEYLVTLTGDGEYHLRDILCALSLLRSGTFGVVLGSRTQSRQQFRASLAAAYGEGTVLHLASLSGAFVASTLFALRCHVILSDPLTGFRIYHRRRLEGAFAQQIQQSRPATVSSVTRAILESGVEVAELPVAYRTFNGFTRPSWRLRRGLRNVMGIAR